MLYLTKNIVGLYFLPQFYLLTIIFFNLRITEIA